MAAEMARLFIDCILGHLHHPDQRNEFLSLSKELVEDEGRNRLICEDVIRAVREARSPLVLTERNRHLNALAAQLSGSVRHLVVLRGGMGRKETEAVAERLARIPYDEERVLLATGDLHLELHANTFRPAGDARDLGVTVDRVELVPTGVGWVEPSWYQLGCLAGITFLAYLLLRCLGLARGSR